MTQLDLLAAVVAALDSAGIDHMVAGSFASTYHGEPRMTQDIDLVIDPDEQSLARFVAAFNSPPYYSSDAAGALRRRDMFNLIETDTGWKVDLIIKRDRPFSLSEFGRRRPATIGGVRTFVATAEDSVLAKLEWRRKADSERQLRDVIGMLSASRDNLDNAYLDHWARELGVEDDLAEAREAARDR